jgi:hypothetical protein
MKLYRPIGLDELREVEALGWRAWPEHRAPLVFTLRCAIAVRDAMAVKAHDPGAGFVGFVARTQIDPALLRRPGIELRTAELSVPASDVAALNLHLVGRIDVILAVPGARFAGLIDAATMLPLEE